MAPFCMITAKKKFWGRTPRPPPSNTTLLDHMQVVCKTLCKTWKARSCPLYSTLALPPSPPFFFLIFKKFVAVENKYSVLDLPGNKFSGRARDENKYSVPTKSARPPPPPPSESNGRPLSAM